MSEQNPNILWLAASMVPKMGPVTLRRQFGKYRSIAEVWARIDMPANQKDQLIAAASQEYESAESLGISILNPSTFESFERVFSGRDNPLVVFAKGRVALLAQPVIAVVGSREANDYGREVARYIVEQLVAQQCTIASGMAQGIDSSAHRAAIGAGGGTIAVLGSSLESFADDDRGLAGEIAESGLLLSQFRSGTSAQKFTFPARNRLIAAISQAVVVVQARRNSGSLLTAQAAREFGKLVFAVPGSIFDGRSAGVHQLLQQDAYLAVDGIGIVKTLGMYQHHPAAPAAAHNMSEDERAILNHFEAGPLHIDQVICDSRMAPARVLALVSQLEMDGQLRQIGPGEYCRG